MDIFSAGAFKNLSWNCHSDEVILQKLQWKCTQQIGTVYRWQAAARNSVLYIICGAKDCPINLFKGYIRDWVLWDSGSSIICIVAKHFRSAYMGDMPSFKLSKLSRGHRKRFTSQFVISHHVFILGKQRSVYFLNQSLILFWVVPKVRTCIPEESTSPEPLKKKKKLYFIQAAWFGYDYI